MTSTKDISLKTENTGAPEGDDELAESRDDTGQKPEPQPGSLASFSDEQLPAVFRQALEKKNYQTLTAVQKAVVEADTDARDLRISSQTGSGKTVAIGLSLGRQILKVGPRDRREPDDAGRAARILLLTPTRELASQVKRELSWLLEEVSDAHLEVVTGGTSVGLERKSLGRGPRIIVGTPGRVLDHLENGGFSGKFIEQVVLDEADQMLDMGFRDELTAILDQLPARKRTHLISATFSGEVLRIADQYQDQPLRVAGTALGAANEDIEHIAHVVGFRHRYDALVNLLLKAHAQSDTVEQTRALVFARTRADTMEVAERLQRDGIRAEPLSGDLAQAQRTRTLAAFRGGRVSTLVATDVAARGLDIQGVDLVIHFEPPSDPDAFTHRSGRTGRAGRKGTSVLLLPPVARGRVERLLRAAGVVPQWAPVPSADKIRKLYAKIKRRRVFAALDHPPPEEELDYARKLMVEHSPDRIIAQLLTMIEVEPVCPPREVIEHIQREHGAHPGAKKHGNVRAPFDGPKRTSRHRFSQDYGARPRPRPAGPGALADVSPRPGPRKGKAPPKRFR